MIPLDRPEVTARDAFSTCISKIRDLTLKARMEAATEAIVECSDDFDARATDGTLHRIARHSVVAPDVTLEEMNTTYAGRMARLGAPGRPIYDRIISAPSQGRCPLCSQRQVSTIDHYLPKAHYPALAVAPLNLVPSCSDCNKAKLESFPAEAADAPLHPYYDNINEAPWLSAEVIETRPAALKYYVDPPGHWDDVLTKRVQHHFRMLGLARLYASEAAEELVNVRRQLVSIKNSMHESGVRMELHERYISCKAARLNGWRTVAYRAWSASEWFCSVGFDS